MGKIDKFRLARVACLVCLFWMATAIVSAAQAFGTLRKSNGINDDQLEFGSLVQGADGRSYGRTNGGGNGNAPNLQSEPVSGVGAVKLPSAPVPATFFGMSMTAGVTLLEPWPGTCCHIQFGGIRLWDSGVAWYLLNPASGVYNWSTLDKWLGDAQQQNINVVYTFGDVPTWASSDPTDEDCADNQQDPGSCDPPNDLKPDGGGTDQDWKDFVTAIVTHAAGHIQYWEIWDEASNAGQKGTVGIGRWKGTIAQMVRMAKDAHDIIRELDPTAVILSPSTRIGVAQDNIWLGHYLATGAGRYADAMAYHGYVQNGKTVPVPETMLKLMEGKKGYKQVLKKYHQSEKPLFDTEASWGITKSTGLTDPDEQAGFVSRFYLMHLLESTSAFYWYTWDGSTAGTLWSPADVVVANGTASNDTASVLLGIGNGSFFKPAPYTVGTNPTAVIAQDVNGDGLPDLEVTNAPSTGNGNVNFLIGNGDGTFQTPPSTCPVGNNPTALAAGDFAKSGVVGLAVTNGSDNTVSVFLSASSCQQVTYSTGDSPAGLAVGDFNEDGILDLAVVNACGADPTCHQVGNVTILLGNSNGTFQLPVAYAVGNDPLSIAVSDFDLDGNLDLAVTNKADDTVTILWGNGDGTFGEPGSTFATDMGPDSVVVGDFNRDGLPDLATANRGTNDVSVLLNLGERNFQPAVDYLAGSYPYSIAAQDFIGNGILDLVTANEGSNNMSVLLGNGDGTFQKTSNFPAGNNPVSIAAGGFKAYGTNYPGTLLKSGCAYRMTFSWLVGQSLEEQACKSPLPSKGTVWACNLSGPNGYQAQMVWDTSQGCKNGVCTNSNYTVEPQYTQYVTLYGQVVPVTNSTAPIGYLPILLENQNLPVPACPGE